MSESFNWEEYTLQHRTIEYGKRAIQCALGKLASEDQNGRTVLLVPGLASGTSVFGPFARELNYLGYQTCVMGHDTVDQDCPEDIMRVSELLLDNKLDLEVGCGDLTIAAHSLGAIHAVQGLARNTEIARSLRYLTLAAPAGYGGVQGFGGAATSVLSEVSIRPGSAEIRYLTVDALKYALSASVRLGGLVRTARRTSVISETQQLIQGGMEVLALLYEHDKLIDPQYSEKGLQQAGVQTICSVSGSEMGHNAHLFHPEEVVKTAMVAIDELEERRCA